MTEETENKPAVEVEVKVEDPVQDPVQKDLVPEMYKSHGGDPRTCDLTYTVLLTGIPTDFLGDPFHQFDETMRLILAQQHSLSSSSIKKIVRVPVLDEAAAKPSNALRALICFTDKMHQCRCLARQAEFQKEGQKVETLESLPESFLHISDENRQILEEEEEDIGDEVVEEGDDEVDGLMEDVEEEEGHDEHEEDDEDVFKKEEDESMEQGDTTQEKKEGGDDAKDGDKKTDKKADEPKKKVYEDEDEKVPYDMEWEGAPEFQWRLCDGSRDEKTLIIDNLMWADLNNVFIYRTIQKATSCDINFPARFAGEGGRACYGKLTLVFGGSVPIMDEALKHLIYFRSGDNRRIKVFLPQTTVSLKRKEEFEGKLGRLIKPTQRMMELVVKVLPDDYTPNVDEACSWFPEQSVIGVDLVHDEMGKPCAIVKFETAQEAVAAHASKSFVIIHSHKRDMTKKDPTETKDEEKPEINYSETVTCHCNVFMRGVEAHFGSLLTFYDQRRKAQEQRAAKRAAGDSSTAHSSSSPQKRPGSTIRGPATKKRAVSPRSRKDSSRGSARGSRSTRGGNSGARGNGATPRNAGRGGGGGGGRRSSPPRSAPRSSGGPPRGGGSSRGGGHSRGGGSSGGRGGRSGGGSSRDVARAPARSSNSYRTDSFSSSSSRGPARTDAFSGYGYSTFENRYNSGSGSSSNPVDPFGRPMYNTLAFNTGSSSSYHSSSHRDDHRSGGGSGSGGFSSFQDTRRRY